MMINTDTFIEEFAKSPEGQAITGKRRGAILATRQEAVDAIAKIEEEKAKAIADFEPKLEKAAVRVRKAEDALEAARGEYSQVKYERDQLVGALEGRISEQEHVLRATSDPEIDDFVREMLARFETVRHQVVVQQKQETHWTGEKKSYLISNSNSVRAAMDAIRKAIDEAKAMQAQAIADVPGRLEELRQQIEALRVDDTLKDVELPNLREMARETAPEIL